MSQPSTVHPQCELWLTDTALERPSHQALLDDAERGRRAAFWQEADRLRFTVAAALLRLVVARHAGVPPERVPVDRSCGRCGEPHGKPRIVDGDLHVSVSHSGTLAAVALTRAAPIGVDVEAVVERDTARLARLVLAPGERLDHARDFFTYWCRKESVVKATGAGLRVPLTEVVVSPADQPARLVSYRGEHLVASMRDVTVGAGYAAAVTVLAAGDLTVETLDGAGLLAG